MPFFWFFYSFNSTARTKLPNWQKHLLAEWSPCIGWFPVLCQQVSSMFQWMLNGCSMDAEWMLHLAFNLYLDSEMLILGAEISPSKSSAKIQKIFDICKFLPPFLLKNWFFLQLFFEMLRNGNRNVLMFLQITEYKRVIKYSLSDFWFYVLKHFCARTYVQ